jgi:hypothetical protein
MPKNATEARPVSDSWKDRRRLPRKTTLLRAIIAGPRGEDASDCMILDLSAGGAQISVSKTPAIGTEICLLDTGNQLAYAAKVMWSKSDRCGLLFLETHTMGVGLPPHLTFLWKLCLETKLKEIDRDLARGVSARLAFLNAGLSEVDLYYMSQCANGDAQFERALSRAKSLWSPDVGQAQT